MLEPLNFQDIADLFETDAVGLKVIVELVGLLAMDGISNELP